MSLLDQSRQITGKSKIIDYAGPSYFLSAYESGAVCINTSYTANDMHYTLPSITADNVGMRFKFISTNSLKHIMIDSVDLPTGGFIVWQDSIGNEVSANRLQNGGTSLPISKYSVLEIQSIQNADSDFVWVVIARIGLWSEY